MVAGLAVMRKRKKLCVHEFGNNLKPTSPKESGGSWTATKSVSNCRETTLKNNRALFFSPNIYCNLSEDIQQLC